MVLTGSSTGSDSALSSSVLMLVPSFGESACVGVRARERGEGVNIRLVLSFCESERERVRGVRQIVGF